MKGYRKILLAGMIGAMSILPQVSVAQNLSPQQDAKKGTWGYVDSKGKWVVKPKYDNASSFEKFPDGRMVSEITLKGLKGYVDENGKQLGAGPVFESVERISDGTSLVKVKGKYGVVDNAMVYVQKPEITDVRILDSERYIITLKGKKGVMNRQGVFEILPEYTDVDLSVPGYIRVYKNGKCGLYNASCKPLIAVDKYTEIVPFEGYWKVYDGKKAGLYSVEKNLLLAKPNYADISTPVEVGGMTFTPVMKDNGKWGVVNTVGKEVLKCRNMSVTAIPSMNLFLLARSGYGHRLWFPQEKVFLELQMRESSKEGPFIKMSGNIDYPQDSYPDRISSAVRFDELGEWTNTLNTRLNVYNSRFRNGVFSVLLNKKGDLISTESVKINRLGDYYSVINNGKSQSLYTQDGDLVLRNVSLDCERNGNWLVFGDRTLSPDRKEYTVKKVNGSTAVFDSEVSGWRLLRDGVIDKNVYEALEPEDNIIHARRDGKWGIISGGYETIPCIYSSKLNYHHLMDMFKIEENGKMGYMNTSGKIVFEPVYDDITKDPNTNLLLVYKGDKKGLYTLTGKEVIPIEYDGITLNNNTEDYHYWVLKGDKYGVINAEGRVIVPVEYPADNLALLSDRYYEAAKGGSKKYYDWDGSDIPYKKEVSVYNWSLDHNIYDKNNNKGLRINYTFDTRFYINEPLYVEAIAYNKNGTPAKNSKGQTIQCGSWRTPTYLFTVFNNQWFTFPYSNFVQPRGTKRDYYMQIRIKNQNGKVVYTSDKMNFYLTR
ncbi:MAG: WG repeat-containing protein [Prevotella sp.]|nr:WG repeat-containing protein [Bacteroides sp.]MCM1366215.1 WG repeat-containing protein [Prevotella sp.]MCM1436967.1 WG repeat-containing protein [Prevotella sp.]